MTFRLDPDLLACAKLSAQRENRTLTNFVETVLKKAIEEASPADARIMATNSGDRA